MLLSNLGVHRAGVDSALWRRLHAPRPGLRARITLAFTLSAALLSTLLAGTTWALTRQNIVSQRESSATRQAFRNSEVIATQLSADSDDAGLRQALASLESDSPSHALIRDRSGRWTNQSTAFDENAVPASLLDAVAGGQPSRMRTSVAGHPELIIGIPLPNSTARWAGSAAASTSGHRRRGASNNAPSRIALGGQSVETGCAAGVSANPIFAPT